jgi:hypothetical protein
MIKEYKMLPANVKFIISKFNTNLSVKEKAMFYFDHTKSLIECIYDLEREIKQYKENFKNLSRIDSYKEAFEQIQLIISETAAQIEPPSVDESRPINLLKKVSEINSACCSEQCPFLKTIIADQLFKNYCSKYKEETELQTGNFGAIRCKKCWRDEIE